MDEYQTLFGKLVTPHFAADEAAKEAMYPGIFDVALPAFLKAIDAECAAGAFLVGDSLTTADFCIGGIYTNYVNNSGVSFAADKWAQIKADFPNFAAYGERFAAANASHLSSRD